MDLKLDNLTRTAQRMIDRQNEEWDVRINYEDGGCEWFIFKRMDAPTVPDVISLVETELAGEDFPVRSVIITNVRGKAKRKS